MRVITLFVITLCCVIVKVSTARRKDDENTYSLEELQDYFDIIEKRMSIELKLAVKKLQTKIQRKAIKVIKSTVEDKLTELLKDGTMESYFDKALLGQVNRIQDDLKIVKVKVMDNTGSLNVVETRQAVLEADLVKQVLVNVSDEVKKVRKDLVGLETSLNNNNPVIFSNIESINQDILTLRSDTMASVHDLESKLHNELAKTNLSFNKTESSVWDLESKLDNEIANTKLNFRKAEASVRELEGKLDTKIAKTDLSLSKAEASVRKLKGNLDNEIAKTKLGFLKAEASVRDSERLFDEVRAEIRGTVGKNEASVLDIEKRLDHIQSTTGLDLAYITDNYINDLNALRRKHNLPLRCGKPEWVPDQPLRYHCSSYEIGATCTVTCFHGIDTEYIVCRDVNPTPQWREQHSSQPPQCQARNCPSLRPPNFGALACVKNLVCVVMCAIGFDFYQPLAQDQIICGKSNRWSVTRIPDCQWREFGEHYRMNEFHYYEEKSEIRVNFRHLVEEMETVYNFSDEDVEILYGDEPDLDFYEF